MVCDTLGTVGKDSTTWQLRARRLTGSRASFPFVPREDFDWPTACLEMEQLISCWTGEEQHIARGSQVDEERGEGQARPQAGGPAAEGQDGGGQGEVEGVGVAAQEVAYGANEGLEVEIEGEDGEMQPILGVQEARLREELGGGLDNGAAALMEQERMAFHAYMEQVVAPDKQENPVDRGNKIGFSPSPALEYTNFAIDHIGQVNSVLLLGGKGAVCATASRDGNVKLWDLQATSDRTLIYTLGRKGDFSTHKGWVWCLASEGPLLASGGFDNTVSLWDLQAGGAERGLIKTGAAVICLSCQPDVLLAGTFDKMVSLYDPRAAEPLIKSLRLHKGAVMCLAADDKYIISGSKDSTVAIYDRRAGKTLEKCRLRSYLVSMSYNGCEVWAGDQTGMLHCLAVQTGTLKLLSQFDVGHTALITGIHSSLGTLYTCSSDRTVKVHIPSAPPRTLCTLHHQTGVHGLSVEAGVLAVASWESSLAIWRPRTLS
ncbi:F-box/WD repeat-containing protein 9 isoform X2 [Cololabis saira]|uniref:F-box/WD repeat-containing protein 9 isoform X2 n=1 Tax=Cololabis saira TaxID=129043 RepID=UPI002AD3924E|nr:F-box/WD repeat-containing protein 9 isoform X2 [Cololabis saira]